MLVNFSFVVCFLIHLTLISKTNARILQAKNESIAIYPIDDQYISIPFNYTLNKVFYIHIFLKIILRVIDRDVF